MDYFEIIKRAASITWKHKHLWVLGFLAALAGSGGNFSNSYNYSSGNQDVSQLSTQAGEFAVAYMAVIIVVLIAAFFIGLAIWVVSIVAQGGLINSVDRIEDGGKPSLAEGFKAGWAVFWKLLGMNIVIGIVVTLLVLIIVAPIIAIIIAAAAGGAESAGATIGLICGVLAFIVGILIMVAVIILIQVASMYASRFIVLRKHGVIDGLKAGFSMMKKFKGPTALTYLLLMVIAGVAGIVVALPGVIVAIPFVFLMIGGIAAENIGMVGVSIFGLIIAGIVIAFGTGILEVYRSSIWTLTFRDLDSRPVTVASEPAETG